MTAAHQSVAQAIIEGQARIMGNVAYALANRVPGLNVDPGGGVPAIEGNGDAVIDQLVSEYSSITGPLGVRMCFTAAQPVLAQHPDVRVPSFSRFA